MAEEEKLKVEKPKTETKPKAKKPAAKKPTTPKKAPAKKTTVKTETKKPAAAKPKTPAVKQPVEKKEIPAKKKTTTAAKTEKKTEEEPKEGKTDAEEEPKREEYKAKKKPELSKELKDKLRTRKQIKKRTPEFLREEWFRYKRIPRNWRRPDGITSKMRINLKYRPSKVRVGFRGPKETRGLHSSGFEEVIVYNASELEAINPKTQAARIGGSVGTRKRIELEKKAEKLDIRVLNLQG